VDILTEAGVRSVAIESSVRRTFPDALSALAHAGLALAPQNAPAGDLAQVDAGISLAACAIAETGSVVLASTAVGDRLVGMLPELHIVLVRQGGLLPTLDEAATRLTDWSSPVPRPAATSPDGVRVGAERGVTDRQASGGAAMGAEEAGWAEPMRYVSLVTGASRTSDIERVLTIGVHGPRAVHVLMLADE
jgi:L-lactate dehydrogenase complex protein LldG